MQTNDSGDLLENWLTQNFRPVQPDPVFIHRLHGRLTSSAPTILEQRPGIRAYVYIALGLFGGALLFWIFKKVLGEKN